MPHNKTLSWVILFAYLLFLLYIQQIFIESLSSDRHSILRVSKLTRAAENVRIAQKYDYLEEMHVNIHLGKYKVLEIFLFLCQ